MTTAIDNWMDLLRDHGDEQVSEAHKQTQRSQKCATQEPVRTNNLAGQTGAIAGKKAGKNARTR